MSLLKPFLAKKRVSRTRLHRMQIPWRHRAAHMQEAAIDSWGVDASHLDHLFKPMWNWLCEMVRAQCHACLDGNAKQQAPSMRDRYPKVFGGDRGKHLFRPVRLCLLAVSCLVDNFGERSSARRRWSLNTANTSEENRSRSLTSLRGASISVRVSLCLSVCVHSHTDNCIQRDKLVDMLTSFSQKSSSE